MSEYRQKKIGLNARRASPCGLALLVYKPWGQLASRALFIRVGFEADFAGDGESTAPDFLDLALAYALINLVGILAVLEFFQNRPRGLEESGHE